MLRIGLFGAFAGAVAIGVPVNALFMQDRPHPAPLFHVAAPRLDPARHIHASVPGGVTPNSAPLPPARPSTLAASKTDGATAELGKTEKPADQIANLLTGGASKIEPKPLDQIAALLTGGAKASSKPAPKSAPAKEGAARQGDRTVTLAQRALAKLGYTLHEDGVYGGTTRQAIEKFERANGMPVKGELTPKILRLLSQRSGVAMR